MHKNSKTFVKVASVTVNKAIVYVSVGNKAKLVQVRREELHFELRVVRRRRSGADDSQPLRRRGARPAGDQGRRAARRHQGGGQNLEPNDRHHKLHTGACAHYAQSLPVSPLPSAKTNSFWSSIPELFLPVR